MAPYISFAHKKFAFEASNFLPNQLARVEKYYSGWFVYIFPSFEILGNFVNEYSKNVCYLN